MRLQHGERCGVGSYPDYLDLRDRNRSFEWLMAYNLGEAGLDTGKNPTSVWGYEASGNYFDALGIQPYLGRFFHASDEHGPNSAPYIVLTYAYWHTHFQDDRGIVGRVVQLNKHPFTILGVAPPEFHGTLIVLQSRFLCADREPGQLAERRSDLNARGNRWIFMTAGTSQAGSDAGAGDRRSELDWRVSGKDLSQGRWQDDLYPGAPRLYGDYLGRPVQAFMTGLMLLAGLILLAACANLGSLFAARAADRSREVALRLALGSSRKRILRGLFTEAMLISLAGGAVGLCGQRGAVARAERVAAVPTLAHSSAVNPDAKVYVVALLLALVSGLLFGAVPVRQVLRTNPYEVVKAGSSSHELGGG